MTGNGHNGAKNGRGSGRNGGTATVATNGRWTTGIAAGVGTAAGATVQSRRFVLVTIIASSSPARRAHGRCLLGAQASNSCSLAS